MTTTAHPAPTALADVQADPRRGGLYQAFAVMLTATPVVGVAVWALATVV